MNINKVIWSEGMLLRPHHFQQQERYFSHLVQQKIRGKEADQYGFYNYEFAENFFNLMKVVLNNAEGIFPDGTYFKLGHSQANALVEPLQLEDNMFDQMLYLCLPIDQNLARYKQEVHELQDNLSHQLNEAPVIVGKLQLKLKTSLDDLSQYTTLPIAKIKACNNSMGVMLEKNFFPPALNLSALLSLSQNFEEINDLIENRIITLAERVASPSKQHIADLKEWMILQILNRHYLVWKHASSRLHKHPLYFYQLALELVGELSTFTEAEKYCVQKFKYCQNDLYETFITVLYTLRQQLNYVIDLSVMAINLEKTTEGIWKSSLLTSQLLENNQIIVSLKMNLSQDEIQSKLAHHMKLASTDQIYDIINLQLPGIPLNILQTIPPSIPYHDGAIYFSVDSQHPLWDAVKSSGQFSIYVPNQFSPLELTSWIIRSQ